MRSLEEIIEEKHRIAVRMILDSGIPIQKAEAFNLADKFKEIILEALVEVSTGVPRVPDDVWRLHCYNGRSIIGRHLIDGKWRHIAQVTTASGIQYFTDAKREHDSRRSN